MSAVTRLGVRFYGLLFLLVVFGILAFGIVVANRAGTKYSEQVDRIISHSVEELERAHQESAVQGADLMDRALTSLSDNLGDDIEDTPFTVFEGNEDALAAYLKQRLEDARSRNANNSREISATFRDRRAAELEALKADLDARRVEETSQLSRSAFLDMLLWGGAFLIGISAVVGVIFLGLVLKPLRAATEGIDRMKEGDRTARLDEVGSEEFIRLSQSFNAMASRIEAHEMDLQETVDRKTQALSQSLAQQHATNDELQGALQELEEAQAGLVESAKMAAIGTLARGMAHEFNNILGGIHGCASELLDDACEDDDARPVLDVIVRTAARASVITENLLQFSRGGERSLETCDVTEVVRAAVALVEPDAARLGVSITQVDTNPVRLISDPSGLQQVFLNLLINGVWASSRGGSIRISFAPHEGGVHVTIEDDGCGMNAELRKRVFEPFFTTREQESEGRPAGTGLGLAVSAGIIKGLGGRITAASEGQSKGSTFQVWVPNGDQNCE